MSRPSREQDDESRLAAVEAACDHAFADRDLLRRALTHPSYLDGTVSDPGYERLEFLGDAVISLVIAEELYARFPDLREGALTKLKIGAVSGTALASAAEELGLADALYFGESERHTGGRGLASALENVFEALTAAVYLDGGYAPAHSFVARTLGQHIGEHTAVPGHPKADLQELVQARGLAPTYRVSAEQGPPHNRTFTTEVEVDGVVLGEGQGRSKKEAEMRAAAAALERLANEGADLLPPA
jgi:ribonuclease-3